MQVVINRFFFVFALSLVVGMLPGSGALASDDQHKIMRLFTTPDERSRIDNLRASTSNLGVDKKLTYRGSIRRAGRTWVWLNNQLLDPQNDQSLYLGSDRSLSIIVNGFTYRLKPGQTLVPSQGLVEDPLNQGTISTGGRR